MASPEPASTVSASDAERVVSLPAPEMDDAELLRQVIEARPIGLRELFDRYAPLARQVTIRMIGPDADVDDLVQEALITVIRRATTLRDPTALRSFVYSVALRTAHNEVRKRAVRRKWLPWVTEAAATVVGPHDAVSVDLLRRVYRVLDGLGPDLREAFVLRFVEGHELAEAAGIAGCSLSTFKRRLSRARQRFDRAAALDAGLSEWLAREGRP